MGCGRCDMVSYQELYQNLEKPLSWIAEDHGGVITKKELRMTIIDYCKVIDRATINQKISILIDFKILTPINKTSYRFVPNGKDSKLESDGERTSIEKEVKRIAGKAVI
jgi:hypothetical protein